MRFEQTVYGTFPFWNRGYGVLARSPGCRPEWLAELRAVCQRYGEPPAGVTHVEGFFATRLRSGPWVVAGVSSPGCDDRGRPGALAFHALFVGRVAYHWIGGDPFRVKHELRHDWNERDQDRELPSVKLTTSRAIRVADETSPTAQLPAIVSAIRQRRRVIVQSNTPIEPLARAVWHELPWRARMRAAVATWAFDVANGFDLVAVPKLTGLELGSSDVVMALEPAGC